MNAIQSASVQPRIQSDETGDPILLVDFVASLLERDQPRVVRLEGAGTTTALKHVAAHFSDSESLAIWDHDWILGDAKLRRLFLTSSDHRRADLEIRLLGWQRDEIIEYLLAVHPRKCKSVMGRLPEESIQFGGGSPVVWRPILDAMACNESATDIERIVLDEVDLQLRQCHGCQSSEVADCLMTHRETVGLSKILFMGVRGSAYRLLKDKDVRNLFVADCVTQRLAECDERVLECSFTHDVVALIGKRAAPQESIPLFLERTVRRSSGGATAASILLKIWPDWKPPRGNKQNYSGAYLVGARWAGCKLRRLEVTRGNLQHADLSRADLWRSELIATSFRGANLREILLDGTTANRSVFARARLNHCQASRCSFQSASFLGASLREGRFSGSKFAAADLTGADLEGGLFDTCDFEQAAVEEVNLKRTNLRQATLRGLDLRTAVLCQTDFSHALLECANLEDVNLDQSVFEAANLNKALLTGSTAQGVTFRGASLLEAGMAEIEWEDCDLRGADLRGVAFHLGSTRCGLVPSPYPSHGTRTGFYTDDFEDLYYKRPEEIRKASLVGCDLRGANFEHVDFYLVDLRGAKYDQRSRRHLAACGAILSDK